MSGLPDNGGEALAGFGGGGAALSDATPLVESGSGSAGTATTAARADHVHPAASGGNATSIQNIAVSATAPTSQQALVYNGTSWVPATVSGGGGSGVPARLIAGFTDSNHFTRGATATADAVGGVGYTWMVCGYLSSSTGAARKVWELQATSVGWGLLINGTTVQMYLAGVNSSTAFNIGITLTAGAAFALVVEYVSGQLRATLNGGTVATTALTGTYAPATAGSSMGIGGDRINAVTYGLVEGKLAECAMIQGALGDSAIQAFATTASTTYSFSSQFSAAQRAALKFLWCACDGLDVRSGIGPLTAGGTLLASQPV